MLRNYFRPVRRHQYLLTTLVFCLCVPSLGRAQPDTLRIATYNLLRFPGSTGAGRLDDFRIVVPALDADILIVQEMEGQSGYNTFLTQVMNHAGNNYQASPFLDGPDTDNGLYVKQGRNILITAVDRIRTDLRDIAVYFLLVEGEEFIIYSMHLKAGSTSNDRNRRLNQTTLLRNQLNQLPAGSNFIVVGDFNVRSSSEASFQKLIQDEGNSSGRSIDPVNQLGNWNNNLFFALFHSQSTRTSSFGDGASGGLDDRFDFILVSQSVLNGGGRVKVLPGTYRSFGNDADHFNRAINSGSNFSVPDSVADALHQASDHLPVFAEFVFGDLTTSVAGPVIAPREFRLAQNFPNPFNPTTEIKFSLPQAGSVRLEVFNLLGESVATLLDEVKSAGGHQVHFDAAGLASGVYVYRLTSAEQSIAKKLLLIR